MKKFRFLIPLLLLLIPLALTSCKSKKINVNYNTRKINVNYNNQIIKVLDNSLIDKLDKKASAVTDTFDYWVVNGKKVDGNYKLKENDNVVAIFRKKKFFTVKFSENIDEQVIREDLKVTRPQDPIRKYYQFIEWQLDGVKFDFNKTIDRDITLKAKFESMGFPPRKVKIEFLGNIISEAEALYVDELTIPKETNGTFSHWERYVDNFKKEKLFGHEELNEGDILEAVTNAKLTVLFYELDKSVEKDDKFSFYKDINVDSHEFKKKLVSPLDTYFFSVYVGNDGIDKIFQDNDFSTIKIPKGYKVFGVELYVNQHVFTKIKLEDTIKKFKEYYPDEPIKSVLFGIYLVKK